jgi:hypothetical protein
VSDDELIERAAEELRRPVRMDSALDARVMATVHALPRHRTARPYRGWLVWLTQPQTVRFSPLGAMAAVAIVVAAVVLVPRLSPDDGAERVVETLAMPEAQQSTGSDSTHMVQFVFVAPTAHSVSLVGDFNNWEMDATPLSAGPSRSVWTVRLPLANGRHRYAFVVDDSTWAADPSAPPAAGDDFGVPSSVITVAERSS